MNYGCCFGVREHHWHLPLAPRVVDVEFAEFDTEMLRIQENESIQHQALSRNRATLPLGEVAKKLFNLATAHSLRVLQATKADKSKYPVYVGLFGGIAHASPANRQPQSIDKFSGSRETCGRTSSMNKICVPFRLAKNVELPELNGGCSVTTMRDSVDKREILLLTNLFRSLQDFLLYCRYRGWLDRNRSFVSEVVMRAKVTITLRSETCMKSPVDNRSWLLGERLISDHCRISC